MRIAFLDIVGFRAFGRRQHFDVDADTVIVVGENGQGKTSLFDSALWALSGRLPRIGDDASVVSVFSESGEARVELSLRGGDGARSTVVRSFDGAESRLRFDFADRSLRDSAASAELLRELWPRALEASSPEAAFFAAFERGVYLQQDRVRDFVEAASDQDRYAAIGELVGAGRVNDLQMALERSRNAWSRASNIEERELSELERRRDDLRSQLERLGDAAAPQIDASSWNQWWAVAKSAGVDVDEAPAPETLAAPRALDSAIKQLQVLEQRAARRREEVRTLLEGLSALPPRPQDDSDALQREQQEAEARLAVARQQLSVAQERAAAIRRQQVEVQQSQEELRALAQIALRHLGDHCPVCDQQYDGASTRARLEGLVHGAVGDELLQSPDIERVAAEVEACEHALADVARRRSAALQRVSEWDARRAELAARAEQLGVALGTDELSDELDARIAAYAREVERLSDLRRSGEQLSLAVARFGEWARRGEITRELESLDAAAAELAVRVHGRQKTGAMLSLVIEGLRDAGSEVIEEQLRRIEPLLQRIYATADPHPAFRVARLIARMSRGRGRVLPSVRDPLAEVESEDPQSVLSSSQLNVLAVSVFLALNLGMPALPLDTVILDDPLQSLDDLNLLGLIDLLRRTRERRQVFISTHDRRFASLLERKLRPVSEWQRTVVIDLQGWHRDGPTAEQRDVERDTEPVRIAA